MTDDDLPLESVEQIRELYEQKVGAFPRWGSFGRELVGVLLAECDNLHRSCAEYAAALERVEDERDRLRVALLTAKDVMLSCYRVNNLRWEPSACEERLVRGVADIRTLLGEAGEGAPGD